MKEEQGFMIESSSGVLQFGTYSDDPDGAVLFFQNLIFDNLGQKLEWDELKKEGFKLVEVTVTKVK